MKLLVTGASGFVAGHYIEYINKNNPEYDVLCIDKNQGQIDRSMYSNLRSLSFREIDLLDKKQVNEVIGFFKPDYILHLAAISSVAQSWEQPSECILNNITVFLNIIETIREICPECRVLSVGSSEEYGMVCRSDLPIREGQVLNPVNPYAIARVSQEQLSKIYTESYNLKIVSTRSFNHIGPKQSERFVVPSFIKRVVDLKQLGEKKGVIETGDINIVRDFVDVRDVVRGYEILLKRGKVGDVYNICSGRRISLQRVLDIISEEVGISVTSRVNPQYIRPMECKEIVGANYKMEAEFDWKPEINIEKTIHDMVEWYMEQPL